MSAAESRPAIALCVPLLGAGVTRYDLNSYANGWEQVLHQHGDVDVVRLDRVPYDEAHWSRLQTAIGSTSGLMVATYESLKAMLLDGEMLDQIAIAQEEGLPVFTQVDFRKEYSEPVRRPFSYGRVITEDDWPGWLARSELITVGNRLEEIRQHLEPRHEGAVT